jgi:O-antigen/teichoic acid export membrane protein
LREVDEASVARALVRTLRASATAVALLVASAMPALAFLVPVIYGGEYEGVPPVLIVLGIAGGLLVMAGPVRAFALARLHGRRLLWANLLSLAVGVGLTVSLVPPLGVWGAVLGNVAAACSVFGFLLADELRNLRLTWRAGAHSVLPFLLGAAACGASWLGIGALSWPPIPSALVAAVAGLGLTVGALRLTRSGMTSDDTAAVLRSVPGRLRGPARLVLRSVTVRS